MRPVPSTIAVKLLGAAELIAERGLDQTKVEDLAEAAGVPKATLYYYFAGKEDILAHLLRDVLTTMADAVVIATDAEGTAAERLALVMKAQLKVMADQPAVCQALVAELGRAGRVPEIAEAVRGAYYTPVERLLAEGAADGSLRTVEDRATTSAAIFGAVTISGLSYLVRGEALDADKLSGELGELLLSGLRGHSASTPVHPRASRSRAARRS